MRQRHLPGETASDDLTVVTAEHLKQPPVFQTEAVFPFIYHGKNRIVEMTAQVTGTRFDSFAMFQNTKKTFFFVCLIF